MLNALRQACSEPHRALNEHPFLASLNGGPVTRERYGAILHAFRTVYLNLSIDPNLAVPAGIKAPTSSLWLRADCVQHQAYVPADGLALPALPMINTPSKQLGRLYVELGAAIGGGKPISQHLEKELHLKPGIDNRFFYAHGPKLNGQNWHAFMAAIADTSRINADEVTGTAKAIFSGLLLACDQALAMEGPNRASIRPLTPNQSQLTR